AHHSTRSRQNVADQISRRLDGLKRPQPLLPRLHLREQRTAYPADAPVSLEALFASRAQLPVQSLADQRFELGALHLGSPTSPVLAGRGGDSVLRFLCHHITCL